MINRLLLDNLQWIDSIARTFCRNRLDAEDLAGETILKVLVYADRYDPRRSFRLWVFVIMRNTFRVRIRHAGVVDTFDTLPDTTATIDSCTLSAVRESLGLIEQYAKASVAVKAACLYAEGYSYREIADMQGVCVNIVKSRICQGRRYIARHVSC